MVEDTSCWRWIEQILQMKGGGVFSDLLHMRSLHIGLVFNNIIAI
jgi:hypothetical protein